MPVMPPPITRILAEIFQLVGLRQIDFLHPGHAHAQIVFGHHLNAVEVILVFFFLRGQSGEFGPGMGPNHAFAQVARSTMQPSNRKRVKIYAARTGAHQRVDATLDLLFQSIDTRLCRRGSDASWSSTLLHRPLP
jgi:hypothetical protein